MSKNEFRQAREILKLEITAHKKATSDELAASAQKYLKEINNGSIPPKGVVVK